MTDLAVVLNAPSIPVVIGIQGAKGGQGEVGITGAQGTQGVQGIQGIPGGVHSYPFVTPAASWVISHNLNGFPAVFIVDSAGTTVEGTVFYNSANQLTVSFSSAFAGTAYLVI